jgi:hypothetical protein
MNRQHATPTAVQQDLVLTYEEVMRDPRRMEQLVRNAHHARNAAIAAMFAAAARALQAGVLQGARQMYAAFAHTHPRARRC